MSATKPLLIFFKPFEGDSDEPGFGYDSEVRYVQAHLDLCLADNEDAALKLAEMLTAYVRASTGEPFTVPGQVSFTHDDEALPPSVFDYGSLPAWLQQIVDAYRKKGSPKLLKELRRLQGIVEAVESSEPDSCFSSKENKHRAAAMAAQDEALGSRAELREKLQVALDALAHYAEGADGDRARVALLFAGAEEDE